MDYARNELYFYPTDEKEPILKSFKMAFIPIVIGAIVLLASWGYAIGVIIGLAFVAAGALWIWRVVAHNKKQKKEAADFNANRTIVTGADLDKAALDHLSNLRSRAIDKLGIDEEQVKEATPIQFHGYYYKKINGKYPLVNYNDWNRSSYYNAVIYLCSDKQIYCYEYRFSLLDTIEQHSTEEVFYRDIVSVATQSDSEKITEEHEIGFENFVLTTSGNTKLWATISNFNDDAVKRSISSMKTKVREKKELQV